MDNKIIKTVKTSISKAGFEVKKHSPEIFLITGIVGVITAAVVACKATMNVPEIIDEAKENIDAVHSCMEDKEIAEEYNNDDAKKDLAVVYIRTGAKLVYNYIPSLIIGALSITSILASNNILKGRNMALAAAYAAVDGRFKEYRNRVAERFGEEVEKELRYNMIAKTITETNTNENGKEITIEKNDKVIDPNTLSPYARFFDEYCPNWEKDSEYNLMFLQAQQQYANDLLKSRGFIFLNEVYDLIGIPRTKAGQIVGWAYDEDNPKGDNYVDFGIYDVNREGSREFVNGYERAILLDFNVDGDILDYVPQI